MNYISSVISISTANGVVSNLSTPYFTITVGNVSGKTIKRIYIEGWEDENTDGKPGWSYVGDNSIATDHNRKYIIYGQGWSLNSSITLSQIVVYFEDGSSVVFDEYDCKIMFE